MSEQGERPDADDWWNRLYDESAQDMGTGDPLDDHFASAVDAVASPETQRPRAWWEHQPARHTPTDAAPLPPPAPQLLPPPTPQPHRTDTPPAPGAPWPSSPDHPTGAVPAPDDPGTARREPLDAVPSEPGQSGAP
ncbi:hypothetical protein GT042_08790, partial [Streptomyces sp. SID3212]|nr:hypothetical protein [Streptomyces sp. SID3212]